MAARGELTHERARSECLDRHRLIGTMVGWLYPSILRDEIRAISNLLQPSDR
jgi:hypothetical protein